VALQVARIASADFKMKQIHICHVLQSLEPGGLENGVVNVVNGLDHARFRSSICCLNQIGAFAQRIIVPNVRIQAFGRHPGLDIALIGKLVSYFRSTRPDIVHTRNAEAFFYGFLAAKIARVPSIVHSEHGRSFDDRKLRFVFQRWMSVFTDRIFAVTDQLRSDLVAHVGLRREDVEVLYNGVDLGKFVQEPRNDIRRELGLLDTDFVIGSVGRLVSVKNYSLLLHAMQAIKNDCVRLLLVGDGPERIRLSRQAENLGIAHQVQFLGHRDDVARCLAAMDVFVLPSISEGMSNTLLEAMGAGIPVVASNVGGNPEILRNGREGLLFASNSIEALKSAIDELMSRPEYRNELAVAARRRVQGEFTQSAMISRYEGFYASIAPRGGTRTWNEQ